MTSMGDASTSQGFLRVMIAADLDSVLQMRNHVDVRRYMLTQHEITMEEHALWFDRASQNSSLELLVLEIDTKCCGFAQFKETNYRGVIDWGFYVAPVAPKGTGRTLGLAAIKHAFKNESTHKICGQALSWNHPSIEFHKSLGFGQEGILLDQHFDGIACHDLICFGLLKRSWLVNGLQIGPNK